MEQSGEKWVEVVRKWGDDVFFGEYDHTMDDKGRVSVPKKFREKLSETFYITRGLAKCLYLFPQSEWQRIEEKLNELPLTHGPGQKFKRIFYSGAMDCTLDKQGRVMLGGKLRKFADLEKNVTLIGVSSRIEIWDTDLWTAFSDDEELDFAELAASIVDLGI